MVFWLERSDIYLHLSMRFKANDSMYEQPPVCGIFYQGLCE